LGDELEKLARKNCMLVWHEEGKVKENRMNRKRWMEVEDELVVHDAS
jgi:hypothetical protein